MKLLLLIFCLTVRLYAADTELAVRLYATNKLPSMNIDCSEAHVNHNEEKITGNIRIVVQGSNVSVSYNDKKNVFKKFTIFVSGKGVSLFGKGIDKRLYGGKLSFSVDDNGLLKIINHTNVEAYLPGVLVGEIGDLKQIEAYKAQAVTARTYTVAAGKNHLKDGYNLCDSAHCQVYLGNDGIKQKAYDAVKATAGLILTYKGKPAATFYHSSCGGRTEAAEDVWHDTSKPYLISIKDGSPRHPYCSAAPRLTWKTKIFFTGLTRIARQNKWITEDEDALGLRISQLGESGRVKELELYTRERRIKISSTDFYHGFGRKEHWQAVKSNNFKIKQGKNYVILEGKGSGHGVGMCQWGAEGMAKKGFDFKQILYHYYPGTEIKKL